MQLTPLDIKKQEFKKSFRGFDPIEVEAFLEMISEEYESVIREKNVLADERIKLKTQLQDYQEVEKTLQDTLMSAQQSIKDSKETSKREAEAIIREAELKSEKILQETKLKLAELKNDLVIIKAQKDSFARRFKHLLDSQLDLLEVLDLDDLGFDKYQEKRIIRKKPSAKQKEEIEFEGIDDVLPDEQVSEIESTEAIQAEDRESSGWLEQQTQNKTEQKANGIDEKKSRISDQLIF